MTNWRKRIGEKELAHLVSESLRVAHQTGAIKTTDLKRVTVDTTVQPKAIAFPTDAKLIYKAIVMLGREAKRHAIKLRQSYVRIGKLALIKAQRYAHAKQFKRHKKELSAKVGDGMRFKFRHMKIIHLHVQYKGEWYWTQMNQLQSR